MFDTMLMWNKALEVSKNAYCPYSKFPVGACVEGDDGKLYVGCNVENASYGLTICAERNAIFCAIAAGCKKIKKVVLVATAGHNIGPCGACRTVIDGMNGWRDLLLCWAEKVKPIYDSITDENLKNNFYLMDVKEKWGCLRIDVSYIPTHKVDEYTSMAEYLSEWTCLNCGKITKSSNSKHLIIYRDVEVPFCKNCTKKDSSFKREVGDWYACFKRWKPDGTTEYVKYDCRELLEGVYD